MKQFRLYYIVIRVLSVVVAGILAHLIAFSDPVQGVLENVQDIIGYEGPILHLLFWGILCIPGAVIFIRIINHLWLKINHTTVSAPILKKVDLTVETDSRISMLSKYRDELTSLCSQSEPSAVDFINELISAGFSLSASDIHMNPGHDSVTITMRIHGQLYDLIELQHSLYSQVIRRIKVLSDMIIFKHNIPQDGHIRFEDTTYTARVAIMPTNHGERVAIRLVMSHSRILELDQVGMPPDMLKTYKALLNRNQGMIILTGPTGSGKSTTMFASLLHIQRTRGQSVNIVTLEDPIETDFEHFHQTQVDHTAEMTFATGLRSIMRQDPDIIMLGEIRDEETSNIAVRAATTGHLLFTTVHANSTSGVFNRLIQMGINPVQLSSVIHTVIAQRLCHRLCESCRHESPLTDTHKRQLKLMGIEKIPEGPFFEAEGCDNCLGMGFTERLALFEMLTLTDKLRDLIAQGTPSHHISREAENEGMKTLFDHGLQLAHFGQVSLLEVIRMVSS